MKGDTERVLPGNAATVQADLPFGGLSDLGTSFLSKFGVSFTNSSLCDQITLIDTPGVLSGDKQRLGRSYDFIKAVEWFAQRADMILLLFDAHKLDISDEFRNVIQCLKNQDDKIRIVLNKADSISNQQLMRVYGALMWSLGKVINTPEVMRVYVGSFRENVKVEYTPNNQDLIKNEHADLLKDLKNLPRHSSMRKVNDLVKRARLARVHALTIEHLRRELPTFFGKASKQSKMIANIQDEFTTVQKLYNLPVGDFPDPVHFQEKLKQVDLSTFSKLNAKCIANLDEALNVDLPALLELFPQDFKLFEDDISKNPFDFNRLRILDPSDSNIWTVKADDRKRYHQLFISLSPYADGKLSGAQAKSLLSESNLSDLELAEIWKLADSDSDGCLSEQEFIIAMHLISLRLNGIDLPESLQIK